MINQHRKMTFEPHCVICGKKLGREDEVISYKGYRSDTGHFGNTIWICGGDCTVALTSYLLNDQRKLIAKDNSKTKHERKHNEYRSCATG